MATLADVQSAVSERLLDPGNEAVSAASVVSSINDSIAYWKFRRFWFNEVRDTATLTQSVGTIPLPSDFLVPVSDDDGFAIEYSNMRYPLRKVSQQEYDGAYLDNGFGLPRTYARIGQEYKVFWLPDQNYTISRHYLKDYAALVAPTDENDFLVYATRLITLWTLANLSAELRQDDKMEAYYRSAANDELNNLNRMTMKSNGTGRLSLSTFLN